MEFGRLVELVAQDPVFETAFLLAGDVDPAYIQQQLSRWVRSERVVQLRRGLYALAPPWRRVEPHPFLTSNRLVHGSYVSGLAALSHYGLIPDAAQGVTAVSGGRTEALDTPFGYFRFQHMNAALLGGYRPVQVTASQRAFVATPWKALLDLVHLTPHGDDPGFIASLRLQNLDTLDVEALLRAAERSGSAKLVRAAANVAKLAEDETSELVDL